MKIVRASAGNDKKKLGKQCVGSSFPPFFPPFSPLSHKILPPKWEGATPWDCAPLPFFPPSCYWLLFFFSPCFLRLPRDQARQFFRRSSSIFFVSPSVSVFWLRALCRFMMFACDSPAPPLFQNTERVGLPPPWLPFQCPCSKLAEEDSRHFPLEHSPSPFLLVSLSTVLRWLLLENKWRANRSPRFLSPEAGAASDLTFPSEGSGEEASFSILPTLLFFRVCCNYRLLEFMRSCHSGTGRNPLPHPPPFLLFFFPTLP